MTLSYPSLNVRRSVSAPQLSALAPATLCAPRLRPYMPTHPDAKQLVHDTVETYRHTDNAQQLSQCKLNLEHVANSPKPPPHVRQGARHQAQTTQGFMRGSMRNKKLPEVADTEEARTYEQMNLMTAPLFLFHANVGRALLTQGDDRQRHDINLGTDAYLVDTRGNVGMSLRCRPDSAVDLTLGNFHNVVLTSDTPRMTTLLAQGPKGAEQVHGLLSAAMNLARRSGCSYVDFYNLSEDKVPSFGQHVRAAQATAGDLTLRYDSIWWPDGEVPNSRAARAPIVDFAKNIGDAVLARPGKTLAVFNCHMGLDRSGIVNAWVQLRVDFPAAVNRAVAVAQVGLRIKSARHHALSTLPRYALVAHGLDDMQAA